VSHFNAHFERTFVKINDEVEIDCKLSIELRTERIQMIKIVYQSQSLFNRKRSPSNKIVSKYLRI
jgi:hypothetical protein